MTVAAVYARNRLLINLAPGHDRANRNVAAAQCFREGDDIRLEVPMLEAEHFSGASKSGLHFVRNEESAVLAAKFLRPRKEIRPRGLAALALNGLDHERGHVTRAKLSIQFIDVVERHPRVETLHQRTESFGETFAAHQRERTETESMECTGERDRAFSSSRGPGKFQRALHRFRAGVAKENDVEARQR